MSASHRHRHRPRARSIRHARRWVHPLAILGAAGLALLAVSCDDSQARVEHNEQRQAVARESALNVCEDDSHCQPTGCRQTLCRALPDETFCPHRLVLVAEPGHDPEQLVEPVRRAVSGALDARERDTLTVHATGGAVMVSFHAPRAQRQHIESLFSGQSAGIYRPHPASDAIADAALAGASNEVRSALSVQRAAGGPRLLETRIEGGDIVSLDDVREAIERLELALADHLPTDDSARLAFEPLWSANPPMLRAWIVSATPAVDFAHIAELRHEARPIEGDNALALSVTLDDAGRQALSELGRSARGQAAVIALGPDVLAAPVLDGPVDDGRFELVIARRGDDTSLAAALDRLEAAPELATSVALDTQRTANAERELPCFSASPPLTECGCVEGRCAWQPREGFEVCTRTGQLPEGHTPTEQ